jgi:mitotic spindle assembly checkpoint protein MAD1
MKSYRRVSADFVDFATCFTEHLGTTPEVDSLGQANALLEKELESLELKVEGLQHRLGRGEFDESTTKVVALRDNPAAADLAVRTSTLESLRKENAVLLDKLLTLQRGGKQLAKDEAEDVSKEGEGGDLVPRQTLINLEEENKRLAKEVAQRELAKKRLSDVRLFSSCSLRRGRMLISVHLSCQAFRSKATEFREAVRSLFGYSIDFRENGRVRLRSAYAARDDQSLEFESRDADVGMMQLVGAGGGGDAFATSESLRSSLRFWVGERGSVPGFLASLTLEMFEMSTRGRNAGWAG